MYEQGISEKLARSVIIHMVPPWPSMNRNPGCLKTWLGDHVNFGHFFTPVYQALNARTSC